MICPSCNKKPSTFLRRAFTLEGATVAQSLKGQFTCRHCGALLRIKSYGKYFWHFYISMIIGLLLLFYISRYIHINIGIVWVGFLIVLVMVFIFAVYKNAILEQVPTNKPPAAT